MARAARQKGGVAYLQCVSIRGVSPRSSQLTRTRPPPSAALRCAATSPPFGVEDYYCLGGASWVRGVAPARSALVRAGAPKLASQKRLRHATVTRPPLGEDGARSATEGGRCVSATRFDSRRICNAFRFEASHQEAPS